MNHRRKKHTCHLAVVEIFLFLLGMHGAIVYFLEFVNLFCKFILIFSYNTTNFVLAFQMVMLKRLFRWLDIVYLIDF